MVTELPGAPPRKRKIAILGGGLGALSTAFWLTEKPRWQDEYEITIYQMGWRLGGKCASGRNMTPGFGRRIQEHGLHMFFGWYDNAFFTLKRAYALLRSLPNPPVRTFHDWSDAFHPHSVVVMVDHLDGRWYQTTIRMPRRPGEPGAGDASLPWDMFVEALTILRFVYLELVRHYVAAPDWLAPWLPECARRALDQLRQALELTWLWRALGWVEPGAAVAPTPPATTGAQSTQAPAAGRHLLGTMLAGRFLPRWMEEIPAHAADRVEAALLHGIHALARGLPREARHHDPRYHDVLADALAEFMRLVRASFVLLPRRPDVQQLAIGVDFIGTAAVGMLRDRVFTRGFESIDHLDLRQWLRSHGARQETVDSRTILTVYDLAFSYEQGDTKRPNLAAGTALLGGLRLFAGYKDNFAYKMQAGMGDTVMTPLYGALLHRGVRFEFFHRVDQLALDPDDPALVAEVRMTRQARLTSKAAARPEGYRPLVRVKDLDCWPDRPDVSQLVDGDQLAIQPGFPSFLESNTVDWPNAERVVLRRGEDFDDVVLGIALGALPRICGELVATDGRWRRMLCGDGASGGVGTVRTQAFQLWFKHQLPDAVAQKPGHHVQPVLGGYAEPFDTWSNMAEVLRAEDWPQDLDPRGLVYCCGPLRDRQASGEERDPMYQQQQADRVCTHALRWMTLRWPHMWPELTAHYAPLEDLLIVNPRSDIASPFTQQYFHANVDPSERYVAAFAGTTKLRLRADDTGFRNLTIAGDWILNPVLNAGFAEGAIASGMTASRALCGWPRKIYGEASPHGTAP